MSTLPGYRPLPGIGRPSSPPNQGSAASLPGHLDYLRRLVASMEAERTSTRAEIEKMDGALSTIIAGDTPQGRAVRLARETARALIDKDGVARGLEHAKRTLK